MVIKIELHLRLFHETVTELFKFCLHAHAC